MLARLFPANESRLDRAIRVVLGAALLALALMPPGHPFGWIGVVPLLTGVVGTCPIYTLFGFRTCAVTASR